MKRSAERAVYVDSLAQIPGHLGEVYVTTAPSSVSRMTSLCGEGRTLSARMLAAVHGEPPGGDIPTRTEIEHWEREALRLLPVVMQADARWFAAWPGLVSNRCDGRSRSEVERPTTPSIPATVQVGPAEEEVSRLHREAQAQLFAEMRRQRERQR
jgi:hypothetical protein